MGVSQVESRCEEGEESVGSCSISKGHLRRGERAWPVQKAAQLVQSHRT